MTAGRPTNLPASIHQRLLNLARDRREDFNFVLTRYGLERLLYRLSVSTYRETFVLKGAMLFQLWNPQPYRPTHDLDLHATGTLDTARLVQIFQEIATQEVDDDGVEFLVDTVRGDDIREDQEYQGARVRLEARLGTAGITIQIDVGLGDAITPAAELIEYPTMLDAPNPYLIPIVFNSHARHRTFSSNRHRNSVFTVRRPFFLRLEEAIRI